MKRINENVWSFDADWHILVKDEEYLAALELANLRYIVRRVPGKGNKIGCDGRNFCTDFQLGEALAYPHIEALLKQHPKAKSVVLAPFVQFEPHAKQPDIKINNLQTIDAKNAEFYGPEHTKWNINENYCEDDLILFTSHELCVINKKPAAKVRFHYLIRTDWLKKQKFMEYVPRRDDPKYSFYSVTLLSLNTIPVETSVGFHIIP